MDITIQVGEETINLTEENCWLFRFRKRPELDHCYVHTPERQFYIFNAPALCDLVEADDTTIVYSNLPTQNDEDAYITYMTQDLEAELEDL